MLPRNSTTSVWSPSTRRTARTRGPTLQIEGADRLARRLRGRARSRAVPNRNSSSKDRLRERGHGGDRSMSETESESATRRRAPRRPRHPLRRRHRSRPAGAHDQAGQGGHRVFGGRHRLEPLPGVPARRRHPAAGGGEDEDGIAVREDSTAAQAEGDREDGFEQEIVRSTMGRQIELARAAFDHVREGKDVFHVSGGDPSVYGKSDLIFKMAEEDDATDIPIEIVPILTAALGGSANVGARCATTSVRSRCRTSGAAGTRSRRSFAQQRSVISRIVLNCWRNYEKAVDRPRGANRRRLRGHRQRRRSRGRRPQR